MSAWKSVVERDDARVVPTGLPGGIVGTLRLGLSLPREATLVRSCGPFWPEPRSVDGVWDSRSAGFCERARSSAGRQSWEINTIVNTRMRQDHWPGELSRSRRSSWSVAMSRQMVRSPVPRLALSGRHEEREDRSALLGSVMGILAVVRL